MFVLKIIALASALLNVGFSATQCISGEVEEFVCQEPKCLSTIDGGISTGRLRLNSKQQPVSIVGYNKHNFLIKKRDNIKDPYSIVGKNNLNTVKFANNSYWKFKVSIHKTTFEICDSTNPNINDIHESIAQTNTNTDSTAGKTSDVVDTSKVINEGNIKSQQNENDYIETHASIQNSDLDEDIDEIVQIESEDESNLETNFDQNQTKMDINLVNESFSEKSDQKTNSEPIDSEKDDLNEKTSQNNTPKPISSQQLENDSFTECTLDSCVNEPNTFKEHLNKYATEEPNDHIQTTQQLPIVEKLDNSNEEAMNNMPQNSSLQHDNVTEELNTESSHQQKSDHSQITQQSSSLEKMDSSINESIYHIVPQNDSVTDNLHDNINVTEESNLESFYQQQSDHSQITQKLPSIEKIDGNINELIDKTMPINSNIGIIQDNDDTEEVNINKSHQPQNENIPVIKNLPKVEENSITKESVSKEALQITDTVVDNQDSMEEFNETLQHENTSSGALQDTSDVVNQQSDKNDMPSLKEEKLEMETESDVDNILTNKTSINEIEKQPDINEFEGTLPESQNSHEYMSVIESPAIISNNDSVDDNTTHSAPLQKLLNATEMVSSTDYPPVASEVEIIDVLNKKSIDQCTSESGCSNPLNLDGTPKYGLENIELKLKPENNLPYGNVQKTLDSNNNEKSKEFEPKSLVSSFGHPDACSGISCLKFKRNVDKLVKPSQPIPKQQIDEDFTSHSTNTGVEEDNKNIINEITDHTDVELNFLDHFQNWLSSPTLSSFNFLSNIFGKHSTEYNDVYTEQPIGNQNTIEQIEVNNHSELYFIVASAITLLFSIIYYKFQKGTYENHLLTLLAAKDQYLLVVEKELSMLKEQSSGNMRTTSVRNSEIETLNEHLTKSEEIISSQAIRIEKLEQEVEELTESGMEMHTLLSSALESSAKNTEKFNILKVKYSDSENLIAALTQKNFDKTTELEKKNGIIKTLQSTVDELTIKNNSLIEDNAKISLQLEQVISRNTLKETKLLSEINNLQFELDKQTNSLLTAENEVALSKDTLQEVMSQKFNLTESKKMLSSIKLSAELKSVKQMCDGYKHKLEESSKLNHQYLDQIEELKNNVAGLEDNISKLEEEKEASVNKLNILTKFFKEQEKEYLKQINEKSVLYDYKEGESSDLIERIKSLNQEIANYKSEIQSLKKEITDQEASFKIQISAADKKASDNWILFRQTERKFKEMELETAQLRNKMTMGDKKLENGAKSIDSSKDFEDELLDIPLPTVSPDFTLLSLLDFEPPPPILTNQRLPPLGALGQAPSPPVPLSRRHERSLSPGSPPPSQRSSVFRPLPQRYNYMNRQNSLGHSVESLDK